jgi:hypothetical protein
VQPPYYAAVIAAEAIGSSGATRAVELAANDARISGYAFYEGALARIVLINSAAYFPGQTNRKEINVQFNFSGTAVVPTEMTVKRLKIEYANSISGLTWGGQTFETPDARPSGSLVVPQAKVSDGVDIEETEVVMIQFK